MGLGFRPFDLAEECKVNWREKSLATWRLLAESREDTWKTWRRKNGSWWLEDRSTWHLALQRAIQQHSKPGLFLNRRVTAFQCCAAFCGTSPWTSSKYTYVPSLLKLPPTPLGHHRAPGWAPCITQWIRISHSKSLNNAHTLTPQSHFSEFTLKNNQWMCANLNLQECSSSTVNSEEKTTSICDNAWLIKGPFIHRKPSNHYKLQ